MNKDTILIGLLLGLLAWFSNHLVEGLEKNIDRNFAEISGLSARIGDLE
jgi:hypothetical protein